MREAAALTKRLREEAKSGLGRLDHDDQTVIADLPRDNLEEGHGSNGFGSKGTGHGWAAEGEKQVPRPPQPCEAVQISLARRASALLLASIAP